MILTRGLRVGSASANLGLRPLEGLSVRSFSSASGPSGYVRSSPFLSKSKPFVACGLRPSLTSASRISARNGNAIRFNSTSTAAPAATASSQSSAVEAVTDAATPVSDTVAEILNNPVVHSGYLKSLGIDFGWGPTSFVQFLLESVHIAAGHPAWWVSIALTAAVTRLIMVKFNAGASDNAAKMANVAHLTRPLQKKMQAAAATRDLQTQMAARDEMMRINRRAGIKYWKSFAPLGTAVFGIGAYRLLYAMANLPVPGMEDGGLLWWQNLTVPDPYYVLPMATALIMFRMMKRGGELGVQSNPAASGSLIKILPYALPAVSFSVTAFMPAGLQWSFFCGSVLSAMQASVLQNNTLRKKLGLTITEKKPAPGEEAKPASPYGNINVSERVEAIYQPPTPAATESKGIFGNVMDKVASSDVGKAMKATMAEAREKANARAGTGSRKEAELKRLRENDIKIERARQEKRRQQREQHAFLKAQQSRDKEVWDLSEEALEQAELEKKAIQADEKAEQAREAAARGRKGRK